MAAPLVQIVTPVTLVTPLSLVDENTEVKTRSGRPPPSYRKKRNPDASSTDDTAKLVPRKTQKQTIFRSPTTRASFSEPPPPDLDPLNGENEARSPDSMDGWLPSSRGSDTDSSDSHHRGPPISVDHEAKEAVPPEVIAQRRLELEAACVQQTGFTLYAFIVLFAITINLPFYLISVTVWDPEYVDTLAPSFTSTLLLPRRMFAFASSADAVTVHGLLGENGGASESITNKAD